MGGPQKGSLAARQLGAARRLVPAPGTVPPPPRAPTRSSFAAARQARLRAGTQRLAREDSFATMRPTSFGGSLEPSLRGPFFCLRHTP